ncbi:MAG: hypothetical protein GXO58_07815 [Thermodesulfobacteria bacterium]|nr:hypothetical protein [Thermodesulfobacteriota bacterium]
MKLTSILVAMLLLCVGALPVFAGGATDRETQLEEMVKELIRENRQLNQRLKAVESELSQMKQQQASQQAQMGELAGMKAAAQQDADAWYRRFSLGGGVTGILMGTLGDANSLSNIRSTQDVSYTIDLNIDADFAKWGQFFVHLEGGDGEGINNEVPSFSVPNYDAYKTTIGIDTAALTISEAYYALSFRDDRYGFNFGKMDISVLFDENDAAGDETTQFMSNIFVKSMGINIPEPDSFYCPAFMLRAQPVDLVEFKVIGAGVEEHGEDSVWHNPFDDGMIIGQINIMPGFLGKNGNYRFYGWVDKRRHVKVSELSKFSINSHNEGLKYADDELAGWGLSFDQEIVAGVTAFARYSQTVTDDRAVWNKDDNAWEIIPVDQSWSVGFQLDGGLWNRGGDAFGFGFAQTLLSDDYEKANTHTANEKYVEAYYRFMVVNRFALTGDFQWIQNAGGNSKIDDIYIWGIRSQIDF